MVEPGKLIEALQAGYAAQIQPPKGPKYERLYQTILQAIREGALSPGVQLPPEQLLSENLPVSQVTVRKCFALLAERGVISREQGRGTFIASAEQSVSDLWHFRFVDPDRGGFMPIYNRILSRTIERNSPVARRLSMPGKPLVRIARALNIGSRFNCYSELFLPAHRFSPIMDEPISELERVNLKDTLARDFRMPTLRVDQNVRVDTVPDHACEPMDVERGAIALSLCVTGYSFEDEPISFQHIWIPKTDYELNLPALAAPVEQRRVPSRLKVVGGR